MHDPSWLSQSEIEKLFVASDCHPKLRLKKLSSAKLLWLNLRAIASDPKFVELGGSVEAYSNHLVEACAYTVFDSRGDQTSATEMCVGIADRYGGMGIGSHGGSGRAAFINGYHVKGIGKTPLVGVNTDQAHSSGGAYLEECVREVIGSEIAAAEFPAGALSNIAIIDTGLHQVWETDFGPKLERCCLLVRPPFLRPAHFERATYFSSENLTEGAHDSTRVASAFAAAIELLGHERLLSRFQLLWSNWARQLAYGYTSRLSQGGGSSSNISFDGQLMDFGGLSALPSLASATTMQGYFTVGREMAWLAKAMLNHESMMERYLGKSSQRHARISLAMQATRLIYDKSIVEGTLRLLGLTRSQVTSALNSTSSALITSAVNRVISRFQSERFSIFEGIPTPRIKWDLNEFWSDDAKPHYAELRSQLENLAIFKRMPSRHRLAVLKRNQLLTLSRENLYRETMKKNLYDSLDGKFPIGNLEPAEVENLILTQVACSRRDSRLEFEDFGTSGFFHARDCSYAIFKSGSSNKMYAACEWRFGGQVSKDALLIREITAQSLTIDRAPFEKIQGFFWSI